uniref:Uncharacterized protein n=1 Tax=Lepeophtheirus salmonis TaxID=72036 RepID=A0A0K2T9X0_LEPSM
MSKVYGDNFPINLCKCELLIAPISVPLITPINGLFSFLILNSLPER